MSMTATLGPHLPYLRRYARALTGSQVSGDAYVRASLEALLDGNAELAKDVPPRLALYRLFHVLWSSSGKYESAAPGAARAGVESRLQALLPTNREALLLTAVEGFTIPEVAKILDWSEGDVEQAINAALKSIDRDLKSRVLIIEDETIIALDIENLVTEMGHKVTSIATTRDDAIRMAKEQKPDVILTNIQLADGGSGIDAAVAILKDFDCRQSGRRRTGQPRFAFGRPKEIDHEHH